MTQLEEYHKVLEEVGELDEREGVQFMWELEDLLKSALETGPAEEKHVYAKFYPMLHDADNTQELADMTEDLHTEFYTHGDNNAKYVQDVVNGLYQEALDRV
jgi:hypothetical protein